MNWQIANAQKELANRRKLAGVAIPLSTDTPAMPQPLPVDDPSPQDDTQAPRKPKDGRELRERVKTYPTINRAFLARDPHNHKRTLAAVGRLYYLLRAIDTQGAGKLALHEARELITHETGMTRRNLRGILRQGHGLTWRVADDCIYLSSPARVALALDCGSLRGRPVYIPIADLCEGIQQVRAAFFATYHGGRRETMPMTRQTIRALTGVPERTQQIYDRVAKTAVKTNIASAGELATKENRQRRAWENGRASFVFTDYRGVNFRKGAAVMAWRLPNSYDAIYEQAPKGRQRKHNQKINLVIKRQQGNDSAIVKTYHPTARIAARFAADDPGHDHYYPTGRALRIDTSKPPKLAGADLWRAIA
jgi:hypothetical protein